MVRNTMRAVVGVFLKKTTFATLFSTLLIDPTPPPPPAVCGDPLSPTISHHLSPQTSDYVTHPYPPFF